MSESARSSLPLRLLKVAGVGVVIVLALVAILTVLRTELPRSPGVMSDAVGPDSGEPIAEYLDRAAASLAVGGAAGVDGAGSGGDNSDDNDDNDDTVLSTGPDAPCWALVSASQAWSIADADRVSRELPRVAGLIIQVPVDAVAMPVTEVVLAEPIAEEASREPVFGRGLDQAADGMEVSAATSTATSTAASTASSGSGDRSAETAALTVARIRAGEPAIIGMIVRGTPAQLRAVGAQPGVRAVEALPTDAVRGRFAVRPLLPQQAEAASPLPDAGPVPAH